jgi:hypothetical protein
MAFESVAGLASFDIVAGQRVPNVSPILYDLIYRDRDRAFLSRVADGPTVDNTEFSWWERSLRPQNVTDASAGINATATTLPLVSGHAARIVEGAILMDEAKPKERIQVTAISGDTLTITRGYGGTTAETHAAGASWRIVALPTQEMSSVGLDLLRHPSEKKNYTQIFRRDLKASRSSQGTRTYSGYQLSSVRLMEKMTEIRDELQQVALFGVPNSTVPLGSDTALRTTGGLLHYVTNVDNTAYTGQTSATLKARLDTIAKELVEKGGDPNFFLAGADIFGAIMDLDANLIRFEVNDGLRGAVVTAVRTKFGPILEPVYDRWFPTTWLCVGDYRLVQMRLFAVGGAPHIEQLAKTKDGIEYMVIGELGFQVSNGGDAFKLLTGLALA